jgi:Zn-dependent protease with chaperone function
MRSTFWIFFLISPLVSFPFNSASANSASTTATPADFMMCRNPLPAESGFSTSLLREVYNRLESPRAALRMRTAPSLAVVQSTVPSASILADKITISSALVEMAHDESEIAFVLAHELGHKLLGHTEAASFLGIPASSSAEAEADRVALELMTGSGFNPAAAPEILERLALKYSSIRPILSGELLARSAALRSCL